MGAGASVPIRSLGAKKEAVMTELHAEDGTTLSLSVQIYIPVCKSRELLLNVMMAKKVFHILLIFLF